MFLKLKDNFKIQPLPDQQLHSSPASSTADEVKSPDVLSLQQKEHYFNMEEPKIQDGGCCCRECARLSAALRLLFTHTQMVQCLHLGPRLLATVSLSLSLSPEVAEEAVQGLVSFSVWTRRLSHTGVV